MLPGDLCSEQARRPSQDCGHTLGAKGEAGSKTSTQALGPVWPSLPDLAKLLPSAAHGPPQAVDTSLVWHP